MTPEEIHAQRMMDEEIVYFVRDMQNTAPITSSSVYHYLSTVRRRKVTDKRVEQRLDYLVDKDYLKRSKEWVAGEGDVEFYEITAEGSDVLDDIKPWS